MSASNTHYVCVDCRVSFKGHVARPCPHCNIEMRDFGKRFKTPKKTNDIQWKKLKLWLQVPEGYGYGVCDNKTYSETKIKLDRAWQLNTEDKLIDNLLHSSDCHIKSKNKKIKSQYRGRGF